LPLVTGENIRFDSRERDQPLAKSSGLAVQAVRRGRHPMKASSSQLALVSVIVFASLLGACSTQIGASPTPEGIPRVALMHVGTDHVPPSLSTLVARLAELGWIDGSQDELVAALVKDGRVQGPRIELIWRNLEGKEQAEGQAAEYVAQHVDVIVAFEDKSIAAAQSATALMEDPIPVVFLHPSDPVRDGLVESLAHPGGNLTGVFGARDPVVRQLELYQQIMPGLRRLLTLVDPTDAATPVLVSDANDAAERLGLELDVREASTEADLERAFHSVAPGEVDGAFLLSPSLRLNFSKRTIELAAEADLPVQAHRKEWLEEGALFSLGVDIGPVGAAGARFVDSILRGTPPAELSVEDVPRVEFAINLARARELGIEVPQDVITRADVVYR
jgi:putative ABC transport system substrate-binding protein